MVRIVSGESARVLRFASRSACNLTCLRPFGVRCARSRRDRLASSAPCSFCSPHVRSGAVWVWQSRARRWPSATGHKPCVTHRMPQLLANRRPCAQANDHQATQRAAAPPPAMKVTSDPVRYDWTLATAGRTEEDAVRFRTEMTTLLDSPDQAWQAVAVVRTPAACTLGGLLVEPTPLRGASSRARRQRAGGTRLVTARVRVQAGCNAQLRPMLANGAPNVVSRFSAQYAVSDARAFFRHLTSPQGFQLLDPMSDQHEKARERAKRCAPSACVCDRGEKRGSPQHACTAAAAHRSHAHWSVVCRARCSVACAARQATTTRGMAHAQGGSSAVASSLRR